MWCKKHIIYTHDYICIRKLVCAHLVHWFYCTGLHGDVHIHNYITYIYTNCKWLDFKVARHLLFGKSIYLLNYLRKVHHTSPPKKRCSQCCGPKPTHWLPQPKMCVFSNGRNREAGRGIPCYLVTYQREAPKVAVWGDVKDLGEARLDG